MTMKILIIDDEEITRIMLSQLLVKEGYQAESVESGEKALELLEEKNFDIVFTDLKMPGMDGIEVLNAIRRRKPAIYVVMITAFATIETAVASMKKGAYDYIKKPFKLEQIQTIIQNIINDKEFRENINDLDFIDTRSVKDCYEIFRSEIHKNNGLCITNQDPEEIRNKYGFDSVEFIKLTTIAEKKSEIHPQNLYKFGEAIIKFIEEHDDPIVLICNIEYLLEQHDWNIIENFLKKISKKLILKNSRLIISLNPNKLDDEILSKLQLVISNINARFIAGILSNPIRRDIIRFIFSHNNSTFTSIFNNIDIDDSSKLSFHLRKLNKEKIIRKDPDKRYSLQRRGRIAANILAQMEKKSISDTQNLISLIMD